LAGSVDELPGGTPTVPDRFITQLALLDVEDEGTSATLGEHVIDEEYGQRPG
jgi:hypothetical protein